MKKLLSISAVLLTAALIFTGCAQPTVPENTNPGPGTWTSNVNFLEEFSENFWTRSKNLMTYNCTNPSSLNIPSGKTLSSWVSYSADKVYGFKAKIKQDKFTDGEYGFIFFYDDKNTDSVDDDSYYSLSFWDESYILYKVINGTSTCLSSSTSNGTTYSNTYNSAIKPEGQENEVIVYSEGNNLVIKVNGTTIKTITRELEPGTVNALVKIPYSVQQNNKTFNTDFTVLSFQTAK